MAFILRLKASRFYWRWSAIPLPAPSPPPIVCPAVTSFSRKT